MATKLDLQQWVADALRSLGGRATIPQVAKHIWESHENDLRASGDLFFTWQYDMRWGATRLREQKLLIDANISPRGFWEEAPSK